MHISSKFGTTFIQKLFAVLLTDRPFARKMLNGDNIRPEHFDTEAGQWVAMTLIEYIDKYNELPTIDAVAMLKTGIKDDALRASVNVLMKGVLAHVGCPEVSMIKEETKNWVREQNLVAALMQSSTLIPSGQVSKIPDLINEAYRSVDDDIEGISYTKVTVEDRYATMTRHSKTIPTGIEVIDSITQGGFGPGELITFVAGPGAGKTWNLCLVGLNMMKQGKRVVHFSLELTEGYATQRYDTLMTGIPSEMLQDNIPAVQKKLNTIPGELQMVYRPAHTITVNAITAYLEKLKLLGTPADVLIADYADLFKSLRKSDKEHEQIEDNILQLRALANEFQIPVFTASQVNRTGAEDDVIEGKSIAGAYSKLMHGDFLISLSRKAIDKVSGWGRYHVIKNRFGPDGQTYFAKVDFNFGKIELYPGGSADETVARNEYEKLSGKDPIITQIGQKWEAQKSLKTKSTSF